MRATLWRRTDPIAATRDEYAAYDSLPPRLRKYLRESVAEISARKVRSALVRECYDEDRVLERLEAWASGKKEA
jgi:hypothetical protein